MKIYEKYSEIADDIIEKYELYNKKNKNYCILKTMINLKNSNLQIIDDLNKIINASDLKSQVNNLIDIYQVDREKYRDITNTVENETDEDNLENGDNFSDNIIQEVEKNEEIINDKKKKEKIKKCGTKDRIKIKKK